MRSGFLPTNFTKSSFTAHFEPGLMIGKTCSSKSRQYLLMHGQLMKKLQRKLKQERNRNTFAKSSIRRFVLGSNFNI